MQAKIETARSEYLGPNSHIFPFNACYASKITHVRRTASRIVRLQCYTYRTGDGELISVCGTLSHKFLDFCTLPLQSVVQVRIHIPNRVMTCADCLMSYLVYNRNVRTFV